MTTFTSTREGYTASCGWSILGNLKFRLSCVSNFPISVTVLLNITSLLVQNKGGISDTSFGMQLLTNLPNNETALIHTGGDYGAKTITIVFPNSKKGLVLFSNSENRMILWQKIITEYFGETRKEIVRRNIE